jgi:DNA-binding transcriptional LysR family regulator
MIDELRHIRAFLAIAELGSFTRAAGKLFMSQPALTVQIRQLEESVGVRLFDRNKRQVVLTPAGRSLIKPFEQLLADLDSVMKMGHDLAELRRGTVTIATLPTLGGGLIPATVQQFTTHHPNITVRIRDVVAESILQLVKEEEVDFGVGIRLRPDSDIEVVDFLRDRLCICFPEGHPIEKRARPTLRDIASFPLILMSKGSSVRTIFERALESRRLEFRLACESNYMSTAIGLIRAGLGIAILPESVVDVAACQGIRIQPIRLPGMTRNIGIIRKRNRALSPAAEEFAARLRETAKARIAHFHAPAK